MANNLAAYLPAEHGKIEIGPVESHTPSANEILIENLALGINPFEMKLQQYAFMPLNYPAILGIAFAGVVTNVGSGVEDFVEGDRVVVYQHSGVFRGERKYQVWQKYVVAKTENVAKLGPGVTLEDASGTIGNHLTVIAAFSVTMGMGRIAPGQTPSKGKKILVYGGSSGVGGLATQVAAGLGCTVVTTSSPRNQAEVEVRGASKIIDHTKAADVVFEELKAYGPYDYIFDTIGGQPVTELLSRIAHAQGGGTIYSVWTMPYTQALPDGVKRVALSYPSLVMDNDELRSWFFSMYANSLEKGLLLPAKVEMVPGGLNAIQGCLDRLMEGTVSGVKLIVNPSEDA